MLCMCFFLVNIQNSYSWRISHSRKFLPEWECRGKSLRENKIKYTYSYTYTHTRSFVYNFRDSLWSWNSSMDFSGPWISSGYIHEGTGLDLWIRTVAAFDLLNEYTPKWLHMYEWIFPERHRSWLGQLRKKNSLFSGRISQHHKVVSSP